MSHSKRNTSLAFFTSYERSLLKGTWGSQSTRLTRDSFLPFASCQLCLLPSTDPVACNGGLVPSRSADTSRKRKRMDEEGKGMQCHIFCRECVLANLLQQKKEIKRLEREREVRGVEIGESEAREDEAARMRTVEDFERVQMGLEARHPAPSASRKADKTEPIPLSRRIDGPGDTGTADSKEEGDSLAESITKKRKFTLDDEALERIASQDRDKAKQALHEERTANAKARELPSFWAPTETPSSTFTSPIPLQPGEKQAHPICPGSTSHTSHPLSLKMLIPVHFTEEISGKGGEEGKKTRSCPACSKPLNNASRAVLAKPCGHVTCGECVERFVLGEQDESGRTGPVRCFVCSADLTDKKKKGKDGESGSKEKIRAGLVEISAEGTGFAGGGSTMAKKGGTAFQC